MYKVALVKFIRGSFEQVYSYKTDIADLEENDVVVVQANNSYSIALFQKYTSDKRRIEKATKWIIEKVDINSFEEKLFLGELE